MEDSLIIATIVGLPFIFVIIIVLIKSIEKSKRDRLRAELYTKAIENGRDVPPDLLEGQKKKNSSLRTGIILLSTGIGISLFMLLIADLKAAATGLIPIFLGLGFLLIHFIWKKQGIPDNEE